MNVLSVFMVTNPPQGGWAELGKTRPPLLKLFVALIFPLSLLPSAMLFYAGTHYGNAMVAGYSSKPWASIALAFFVTEVLTVVLMGWLVGQVAKQHQAQLSVRDAYLIAGLAPVPLWLSSLALLVPNPLFTLVVAGLALAFSCRLVYNGVYALCQLRDGVAAAAITHTVMGANLFVWAMLLWLIVAL